MKTALKILVVISLIVIVATSCESAQEQFGGTIPPPSSGYQEWTEFQNNIRPTKPIRIPDTMRITTADPDWYVLPQDSIPEQPQDSTTNDNSTTI